MLKKGCVILLWHYLGLPYNYFGFVYEKKKHFFSKTIFGNARMSTAISPKSIEIFHSSFGDFEYLSFSFKLQKNDRRSLNRFKICMYYLYEFRWW